MSEFRLPSGEWRCTQDHRTEPCGKCGGCYEVRAENVRVQLGFDTPVAADTWPLLTRRQYLVLSTMEQTGCDVFLAMEAVASTALENPTWDMNEKRTFQGWDSA